MNLPHLPTKYAVPIIWACNFAVLYFALSGLYSLFTQPAPPECTNYKNWRKNEQCVANVLQYSKDYPYAYSKFLEIQTTQGESK